MKKLLSVLFLGLSFNALALDGHFRIGGVTNASTFDKDDTYESYSPSFGFEVTQNFLLADLGVGIVHNKGNSDVDIDTTPVYGIARFNIFPIFLKPYVVAKLGYVAHSEDNDYNLDGSEYYGLGVGVNFANLQAEVLYSETKFEHKDLEQVSFIFGFQLF